MLRIKFSKSQVKFEHPAAGMDHCSDCEYFKSPNSCRIVEGVIQPGDWCKKFKEKKMAEHGKKKHAGHGYHRTEIEHHADGSHTVHHHPHPDHAHEMPVKSYAVADHDGLMDGMMDHTSAPNPGEAEANAGPAAGAAMPGGTPAPAGT